MTIRYTRSVIVVLVLFLTSTAILNAQVTTASINGVVTDKSGQPLLGATIRAIHGPSGSQYGTSSRDDGRFNLTGLRVGGPYSVKVTYVGYATQEKKGINLELGQNLQLDFSITEEAVEVKGVVVTGEQQAILSASHTGAVSNISRANIESLPSITRTFTDYLKLSPYFIGNSAQGRNNRYNNIQIDGANFNDLFGLGTTGMPGLSTVAPISLESIQEFQISVSPYDVRQSGFTGAGVNAVTRSGSNDLSGAVYGYGRNQNFMGKSPDALHSSYADFYDLQEGFRIGGAILKDKLFYFASGELTQYNRPLTRTFGSSTSGNTYSLNQDSLNMLINKLKNTYGYDPGSFTNLHFQRQSVKFLLRFDYNIDENNKLTLRDNFMSGTDDNSPSVGSFYAENTMYQLRNTTNSIVAQLNSVLSDKMANELYVGYTYSKDDPVYKGSLFPLIEIYNIYDQNRANGIIKGLNLYAGAENYRIKNLLTQQDLELTDNFTYFLGKHTITVGTHNEMFAFEDLYIANAYGWYDYNYYADFLNNRPAYQYQLSYSNTSNPDQAPKFGAIQYGFYAQDEWNAIPNLRISYGLRIDIPTLLDNPAYNAKFYDVFGRSTSIVPSGQVMYSPRVAFNYDLFSDRSVQVRAGTGLFTGRVPYVWISNQYGNTGVEFARLNLINSNMTFYPTAEQQRQAAATATPVATTEVDITDKNYKMPQIWRTSAGIDIKLPFDFVGTIEGVYSQVANDIMYQDINMKPTGNYSADGRPLYGTSKSTASSQSTSWTYSKVDATDFTNAILLSNTNQGYSSNLTAQIQRANVGDGWDANVAYVYGVSKDMNSGASSQAASQWKYNHAVDPNNPTLSYSQYDRRNRVMATVSYRLDEGKGYATTFGAFYSGLSGQPYSWIISGDVNGDGQTTNDLAYIPNTSDIGTKLIIKNSSGTLIKTAADAANDPTCSYLLTFINNDPYLSGHKGQFAERMGAHTIWSGQIDLHIGQELPICENHRIEVSIDILNVMNLLNQNWGWIRYITNQQAYLFNFAGYSGTIPVYTVGTLTDNSYNSDPASRWELQLGAKYSF